MTSRFGGLRFSAGLEQADFWMAAPTLSKSQTAPRVRMEARPGFLQDRTLDKSDLLMEAGQWNYPESARLNVVAFGRSPRLPPIPLPEVVQGLLYLRCTPDRAGKVPPHHPSRVGGAVQNRTGKRREASESAYNQFVIGRSSVQIRPLAPARNPVCGGVSVVSFVRCGTHAVSSPRDPYLSLRSGTAQS